MAPAFQTLYERDPAFRRLADGKRTERDPAPVRSEPEQVQRPVGYKYLQVGGLPLPTDARRQANALVKAERRGVAVVSTTRYGNVKVVHVL